MGSQSKKYHTTLAEYFHSKDYYFDCKEKQQTRKKPLPLAARPVNIRKVMELPWQLLQNQEWEKIEILFTDLIFLEAKTEAGKVYDLLADFSQVVKIFPNDHPRFKLICLINEALQRDIHFIARHYIDYPQGLFQCMWNSCWWFDSPESSKHYLVLKKEEGESEPLWEVHGESLFSLLERWRASKEKTCPGFSWLRSTRPPYISLGLGQEFVLMGHESRIEGVAFSPNGDFIVSASLDRSLRLWDAHTGFELAVLQGQSPIHSVAFSPTAKQLASGCYDHTIQIWDLQKQYLMLLLKGHLDEITTVVYSPSGDRLASCSKDRSIKVWDSQTGSELMTLNGHTSEVNSIAFSPDGKYIVSGSGLRSRGQNDFSLRLWDVLMQTEVTQFIGHLHDIKGVAFSPDGNTIASCSFDQTIRIWDVAKGNELKCFENQSGCLCIAYSPNGCWLAVGCLDGSIDLWDTQCGKRIMHHRQTSVHSIAWSPDGQRLVYGMHDCSIQVWSPDHSKFSRQLIGHRDFVDTATFSLDGRYAASGSYDHDVRLWNGLSGEHLHWLSGHHDWVTGVWFMRDGRLISSSDDGTTRVWNPQTGKCDDLIWERSAIEPDVLAKSFSNKFEVSSKGHEIEIFRLSNRENSVWFPGTRTFMVDHPINWAWLVTSGNHVFILYLEGSMKNP